MKASLQLRTSHSLKMTPQLQQQIRMLQLSSTELQTEIRNALESNIMLEEKAEETNTNTDPYDSPENDIENISQISKIIEPKIPDETSTRSPDDEAYSLENDVQTIIPNWEDAFFDNSPKYYTDSTQKPYHHAQQQTLQDHLNWQLNLMPLSDIDYAIAVAIIDALDNSGYLNCDLEDIRAAVGSEIDVGIDEIEAVLHLIQVTDPVGCGARNLRECLNLQLNQFARDTAGLDVAKSIVQNHLKTLARGDSDRLIKQLKLDATQLQEAIALIQSLQPCPSSHIQTEPPQYQIPDVYLYKQKNHWIVKLNPLAIPSIRINSSYAGMVRRADNSTDNMSLKTHLREARWLIRSLKNRNETLLRVTECIARKQRAFLEHGVTAMKPMVSKDIADLLDLHPSTVLRTTTNKYVCTPLGIFELKYFFSSHVNTKEGEAVSSTAICALIKKLVANEKPHKPLSDTRIVSELSKHNIKIARRTVAKYRQASNILAYNERKRLP